MLTFRTLGAPRLLASDGELLRGRRKELALLAFLARRSPRPVSRAELADLLWGERPETSARQSLRQALLHLKRALPVGLQVEAETVTLARDAVEFDVAAFERDVAAGRLADSVNRWDDDFLAGTEDVGGEAYRAWVETERAMLRKRLAWALEQLADEAERRGDKPAAVRWAERWAEAFPLEERPRARLIEALRRASRAGDALAQHAAFVTRLRQDLELEPSPEFRRLAAEAAHEAPKARPSPGSTALFTPELVGRAAALKALWAAWASARAGAGAVVLVEGDEGMGKTRLCEEFLRGVTEPAVVLRARGYEAGREMPWSVAHELLAGLKDASGLPGAPLGALAAIGRLVPAIRERYPAAPGGAVLEWSLDDAAADVLAAVAAEVPILLFVDDFPAADRASQELVLSLARRLHRVRLCLLLASRTDDAPTRPLAELRGAFGVERVRLQPLTEAEVEALLASMLELAPDARRPLAQRLHVETGGNPFFVIEMTAALLDEGHIAPDSRGAWQAVPMVEGQPLPIPPTIRDAVSRRSSALSESGLRLAEAAAVLARPAAQYVLARVVEALPADIESALEELLARRLLRVSPQSPECYEFAHEVSRRVIYDRLDPARRRGLHAAALRALRVRGPADHATRAAWQYHRARAGPAAWPLPAWARSRRAAVTLGALLVIASTAAIALWPRGIGFREREWIVLTDLKNATGDSVFDQSLAAALSVALSQSRHVNVFPRSRVRETLRRMRRDAVERVSEPLAREIAQREGLRGVVALELVRGDTAYTFSARVVDPPSGADLAVVTATAPDRVHVLNALDGLARRLRRKLGESQLGIMRHGVHLPQASTSSLEALKRFAEGSQARTDGRYAEAVALWKEAIALDSEFAWAHAALGSLKHWLNNREEADVHFRTALNLLGRLPERERLWVRYLAARDREDGIRLIRTFLREYPDDRDAWYNLGRSLQSSGGLEEALDAYERALEIDREFESALVNGAVCYDLLGRPRQAVAAFERAIAIKPATATQVGGDLNRIYGFSYLRLGDSARARAIFERMLGGDTAQQANGLRSLALFDMYYGRYSSAIARLKQAVFLNTAAVAPISEYRNRLHLAAAYRAKGMTVAADAQLIAADEIQRRGRFPALWLGLLGQQYAKHGRLREATRILDSMMVGMEEDNIQDREAMELVKGEIALAKGDLAPALETLETAARLARGNHVRDALARARLAAGQWQEAAATYQEMLRDSALGWEVQEPWIMAHYNLGRLLESRGDTTGAIILYERLTELWKSGDEGLMVLADARQRLAALRAAVTGRKVERPRV